MEHDTHDQYQREIRRLREQLADAQAQLAQQPRRLTKDEILRAHLERMVAAAGGDHSTVKISRNAKGDVQLEVSVRTGEHEGVTSVEEAAAKAQAVYDTLRLVYPMGGGDA